MFAIKADKIAQALRVPTSKLHWVAAVHNTKHHPHAHFIAYSTEQKSRIYLSEDAIEQLKSEFVSEIFAEERHQIFAPREEARQQLEDRLETLFTQLEHNSNAAVTDLLLPEKLAALRKSIESASGRHVYKYLPKDTKAMVDKLLDEISEVPEIKELLTEYNKYQQQLEAYYKTPDELKPLSAATTRSNLYPLKNLVVQYALQFEPSPPLTPKTENSSAKTGSTSGFSYSDALDEPENAQMNEPFKATWKTNDIRSWRDNMKVQSSSPPYDGTAEEKYRYAQYLRYDEKCPQDAILWYNLAEQLGHTEAAYQLAQYYLKKGEDQDVELGNYYLLKAKLGFEDTLLDSVNAMQLQAISAGNTYADTIADFGPLEAEEKKQQRAISRAAYFLGRIYTTGIEIANIDGIESEDLPALQVATDPHKAAAYFEFAYRSGYKHAAYYLGNLYFHGKLSPADKPDYERAAGWYMADAENSYCQFALAKMIEHGQGFTPNVETAEILYRKCLNVNDYLTAESSYAIAQMQNNEQLPLTDMQKLYKTAAEIWLKDDHPENHIHLRLARMYEYGLGVPEDLSLAIDHYKAALKTPETEYKLGQLMQRIDGDATEIYAHYAAARVGMLYAEEHSPTSATAQQAVRLATMYRYGLGCDADHETAVHWYTVAAERGSIYAQQRLEVMEMQRIRQEQRAAEYAEKQQQQQNLSFAARLLNTIGNALCRQTLRDQQSATATTDRKAETYAAQA